jgi:nucleoside-diphosphate-sugar epimerase
MIYELISGKTKDVPPELLPLFVDVRDVARAHVLALKNDSVIGKRVLLSSGPYTLYEVRTLKQKFVMELDVEDLLCAADREAHC